MSARLAPVLGLAVLGLLLAARDLIADEASWETGFMASNVDGARCAPSEAQACRWCAWGALCRFADQLWPRQPDLLFAAEAKLLAAIPRSFPYREELVLYNDARSTSHADILALYDAAIAATEAELVAS